MYTKIRDHFGDKPSELLCTRVIRGCKSIPDDGTREAKIVDQIELISTWRDSIHADTITDETLPLQASFFDYWPSHLYGSDEYGHVINYECLKLCNQTEFLKNVDKDLMLLHRAQQMERIQAQNKLVSKNLNRRIYKHIYILNLDGITRQHLSPSSLSLVQPLFDMGQVYYPESLHRMYIINAPFYFRGIWAVISPWIDAETREKIHIIGTVKAFLQKASKDGISLSALPISIGGTHPGRPLDPSFQATL